MARSLRAARFGGPIGALLAETQERVLWTFLGPLDGPTVLDVGTGTGRAAIALAARGRGRHGRGCLARDAAVPRRARAEARASAVDVHGAAMRTRSRSDCSFRRRGQPARADAHARLAAMRGRIVPGLAASASWSTTRAPERGGHCRRAGAASRGFGGTVEAYRVLAGARRRATLSRARLSGRGLHRQFVLPIALHKRDRSRAPRAGRSGCSRERGCCGCSGRP